MYSTGYLRQILTKFEFSRQIFENYSNIKFNENPSSEGRSSSLLTDRQTGTNTNTTKLTVAFRKFCERA